MKPSGIAILIACCCLLLTDCGRVGPRSIPRDRFNYSAAVASSWKEQTLLNIVKLRYLDTPVFLEVGQIVSSYTLSAKASVGGTLSNDDSLSLGGSGTYEEHPTITYTPLTGQDFLRGLMTPIDPSNIFFLIESGYRADRVLEISAESVNGLRNRASSSARQADPEFVRALELMGKIQESGGLGMKVDRGAEGESTVVFFRKDHINPETGQQIAELRELLGLSPDQNRLKLVYSPVRGGEGEFAIGTRSLLQIQFAMAQGVEVPPEDLEQKRAIPVLESTGEGVGSRYLANIHCSKDKSTDAYVSVRYRDHWFWIADTDLASKRTFGFVMLLFTLANTGNQAKLPVLTIGAN